MAIVEHEAKREAVLSLLPRAEGMLGWRPGLEQRLLVARGGVIIRLFRAPLPRWEALLGPHRALHFKTPWSV